MSVAEASERPERGFTLRALVIAVLFAWLGDLWMKYVGIIAHTIQLGESVPAIPAVAGLLFFLVVNPLLARLHPKLALRRAELVIVFVILCITPVINSVGCARMLLPSLNVASYYATPENKLDACWEQIPGWYGPRDPEIIRQMYEGADDEAVPWAVWWPYLLRWLVFATVFFGTLLCCNSLLRRQWTERERLAFPLVQFVSPLIADDRPTIAVILRNPLLWLGISISFVYNLLNMLHAVNPAVPAPSVAYNLGALFTDRPMSAISDLQIQWRPEVFGLGYLMSTEVTFSVWVLYLLVQLSRVVATAFGAADQIPGFPFEHEMCTGSYLAVLISVLYISRRHLARVLRCVFTDRERGYDAGEPISYRWAFTGAVGGFVFLVAWAVIAGMALWLALLYFTLLIVVALVYTRIRAETGAPMVWLFPYWEQQKFIDNLWGSAGLAPGGDLRSATVFHAFAWMARGYFPTTGATQLESFKLGDEAGLRRREVFSALLFACVLGFALAFWAHMTSYYQLGGNVLERGDTEGGYRIVLMRQAQEQVAAWTETPLAPDVRRNWATLIGFLFTGTLVTARSLFLRFPVHPLGFAMATAYGRAIWGPSLFVWVAKTAILRIGGVRLYKQLIPFFIGIILGQFFTAGCVWGMVALFNEELAERYGVWFG